MDIRKRKVRRDREGVLKRLIRLSRESYHQICSKAEVGNLGECPVN